MWALGWAHVSIHKGAWHDSKVCTGVTADKPSALGCPRSWLCPFTVFCQHSELLCFLFITAYLFMHCFQAKALSPETLFYHARSFISEAFVQTCRFSVNFQSKCIFRVFMVKNILVILHWPEAVMLILYLWETKVLGWCVKPSW